MCMCSLSYALCLCHVRCICRNPHEGKKLLGRLGRVSQGGLFLRIGQVQPALLIPSFACGKRSCRPASPHFEKRFNFLGPCRRPNIALEECSFRLRSAIVLSDNQFAH
eukprot:jgi/Botrbrau1/5563/Bobra.0023s0046.1